MKPAIFSRTILTQRTRQPLKAGLKFQQAAEEVAMDKLSCYIYELCERIWCGSPVTEQIVAGEESTDIEQPVSYCDHCVSHLMENLQVTPERQPNEPTQQAANVPERQPDEPALKQLMYLRASPMSLHSR